MAENCTRSTQKMGAGGGGGKNSMSIILKIIMAAFSLMKQPAQTLPPPLVMIGSKLRPGLSARDISARVISRFSEADGVAGEIFQGGNNVMTALEVIRMEEIVGAIQTEMKITSAIDPGSILVQSNGVGYAGWPVASVGTNPSIVSSAGVAQ
tara:strand:- start:4027 stop:4482 length:456 start_codon:yes stop_codon:yes gene_type:complete